MKALKYLLSGHLLPACIALGMALCSSAWAADRVEYAVSPLGQAPVSGWLWPWKMNDHGDVVGLTLNGPQGAPHPFVYRQGVVQQFDIPGDAVVAVNPRDINNGGYILCDVFGGGTYYPVLVLPDGGIIHLNDVLEDRFFPVAMNDAGDVVGNAKGGILIYNYNTGTKRYVNDGFATVNLSDINNQGQVLGTWYSEETATAGGTVFTSDSYYHFQLPNRKKQAAPLFINNKGVIGGVSFDSDPTSYNSQAFLYEDGHFTHLGFLLGDHYSGLLGLNDNGEAVGWSAGREDNYYHPFIHRKNKMTNLNALIAPGSGWLLEWPDSINNKGQIVGTGYFQGQPAAFILTPIPQGKK